MIVADNLQVAFLPGGMASGKAAILLRIDLPDGRVVITETSHALFDAAAAAFRGREAYLADLANQGGEAS